MTPARVVHLDDADAIPVDGTNVPRWTPLRRLLGVDAFGISAWTAAAAGEYCVEPHDEGHREAVAREAGTTVLAIGGTPGAPFTPSDWEDRWLRELGIDLAQPQ